MAIKKARFKGFTKINNPFIKTKNCLCAIIQFIGHFDNIIFVLIFNLLFRYTKELQLLLVIF